MKILGISAFYHDSAASLLIDGEIIAAAQEERFTRKKQTPDFPVNSIKFCLEHAGLNLDDLDAVVFYEKPFLKFERLLETYYAFAPRGLWSFLKSMPVWLNEKLFLKKHIAEGLAEIGPYDRKKLKLLFSEHHLSHAASAFYPSPFEEAAILTIDGVGEWCTASMSFGKGNSITTIREMNFPHSVGLLYSAFTYYLGFTVNSGEYKVMGLAPYGNAGSEQVKKYIGLVKSHLVDIKEDGSVWLDQSFFNYSAGLKMTDNKKWKALFGFARRNEEEEITQQHCDLAQAIQKVTEEIVTKMAIELKKLTGADNLCLAGGVALNCVANSKLQNLKIFKNIYVQPAAGDAGGSLGAALATHHIYFENPRKADPMLDQMQGTYLGPDFSEKEIEAACKKTKAVYTKISNFSELTKKVAYYLARGHVIGWFQGRMEFGPRALGNRSILADATWPGIQKQLNLKIKNREGFRPFAPSVMAEEASSYFALESPSPYMLFVAPLQDTLAKPLPSTFEKLSLMEKLYVEKSPFPAITHVDFTARVQTVSKEANSQFWSLLEACKKETGHGILVNTSFNVRGEPMV